MKNKALEVAEPFVRFFVGDVVLSSITLTELEHGMVCSSDVELSNGAAPACFLEDMPVVPFEADAIRAYGSARIAAARAHARSPGQARCGRCATVLNVVLVTHNEAYFLAYPGLSVESWIDRP
jgi:tRNA(fMet)-specific endonuclease VapC